MACLQEQGLEAEASVAQHEAKQLLAKLTATLHQQRLKMETHAALQEAKQLVAKREVQEARPPQDANVWGSEEASETTAWSSEEAPGDNGWSSLWEPVQKQHQPPLCSTQSDPDGLAQDLLVQCDGLCASLSASSERARPDMACSKDLTYQLSLLGARMSCFLIKHKHYDDPRV